MNFTDTEFSAFEADLKRAMSAVCRKYQIELKKTRISYGPVEFDMKLTFRKDEEGLNAEEVSFRLECDRYGFQPEDYMRLFEYKETEYEFIGFDTSARKYNCVIREIDTGTQVRVNNRDLQKMIERDAKRAAETANEKEAHRQEEVVMPPELTEQDLSFLEMKLGKSKRNEKDWKQIHEILTGKLIYSYQEDDGTGKTPLSGKPAVENGFFAVFTSQKNAENHLDLLSALGRFGKTGQITGFLYEKLIRIAEAEEIDIIFDPSLKDRKLCLRYDAHQHKLTEWNP